MSRKSVLITITEKKKNFHLSNFDNKFFVLGLNFSKTFKQLLLNKGVLLINEVLNFSENKLTLHGELFFTTKLLKQYKKHCVNNYAVLSNRNTILKNSFNNLTKELTLLFKFNIVLINFVILNKFSSNNFILFFFKQLKSFIFVLFKRRFNLYVDFIKLTSLYFFSKIDIGSYLYFITNIFRYLQKRSHSKFVIFLDKLFKMLVFVPKQLKVSSNIAGLKVVINGRLKGKTRSSSIKIQVGSVPTQSINQNIEYSKQYTFTKKFGVFGFKMWTHKKL